MPHVDPSLAILAWLAGDPERDVVMRVARGAGHAVHAVAGAAACREALLTGRFDVVISDRPEAHELLPVVTTGGDRPEPASPQSWFVRGPAAPADPRGTATGLDYDEVLESGDLERALAVRLAALARLRAAERAAAAAADENRLIRDTIQTGVIIVDVETLTILDANRTAGQLLAVPCEGLVGRSCKELLCTDPGEGCPVLTGRASYCGSASLIRRDDGSEVPVLKTVVPVELDGRACLFDCFVDVSEQKNAERRLQETLDELEAVFDSSLVGIMVLQNRVITKVNRRLCEMFGFRADELIGEGPEKLHLSHEKFIEFGELYYWRLAEREICEVEYPLRHRSGRPVWCQFSGKALAPPNLAKGAVWVITDITARKRQELELREAQENVQRVLDTAATAVFTVDTDLTITSVNRAFSAITGYQEQDVVGHKCSLLNGDACREKCVLFDPGRDAPIHEKVCTLRSRDGRRLFIRKNAQVLWDDYGRAVSGIESFVDITELVTAREQAEGSTRAKAGFLANMSHEIRTPMNGIIGLVDLLSGTDLDDEQAEYCRLIATSAGSLVTIINDILDVSRIEAGKLRIEAAELDLRQLVEDAVAGFAAEASRKRLELGWSLAPGLPVRRTGDASRFRQVLLNLLGNAVKFTTAGSVAVRVTRPDDPGRGQWVRCEVRDTGIGIPEARLQELFEPFTQADASTTRRFGGTGLGLAISKQIVDLMGGEIGAVRNADVGSCFWFELPLPEVAAAAPPPPRPAPDSKGGALEGRRVLVVEDNSTNRLVATRLLQRLGVVAETAVDGVDALARLRSAPFDLVLMDVQMPEMDGLEATRRIRAGEPGVPNPGLPIVALTAHAMAGDREACLAAGMDDYLSKPIDPARLREVLVRWLDRSTVAA